MKKNIFFLVLFIALLLVVVLFEKCKNKKSNQEEPVQKETGPYANINANAVPYFVLGDLNNDRKVTKTDLELLRNYVAEGKKDNCNCLAAGDWTGNGEVNKKDLEQAIEIMSGEDTMSIPLLAARPDLPCDYKKPLLFAQAYLRQGEALQIHFAMDDRIPEVLPLDDTISVSYDSATKTYTVNKLETAKNKKQLRVMLRYKNKDGSEDDYDLDVPIVPDNLTVEIGDDRGEVTHIDSEIECPQRGKGCEVLILDFKYNNEYLAILSDSRDLPNPYTDCGCNVIYSAPKLNPLPAPRTVYRLVINPYAQKIFIATSVDSSEWKAVDAANGVEWAKMLADIAKHRQAVAAGKEVAIEIIMGHGSAKSVGSQYDDNRDLYRTDFHTGNYNAAKAHVCAWFNFDMTCQAGFTPIIVDNLENLGVAKLRPNNVDGNAHAGWEKDYAYGACKAGLPVSYGHQTDASNTLKQIAKSEAARRQDEANSGTPATDHSRLIDFLSSNSFLDSDAVYSDKGYKLCQPHSHVRHKLN